MKKLIILMLLTVTFTVYAQRSTSAERVRIASERANLEAGFASENSRCYKNYLVTDCLNEVTRKRRAAMADLSRQEMTLNKQDRIVKATEQLRKTEEKASPEKQQQAADKRSRASSDLTARLARDREKNAAHSTDKTNEKSSAAANETRLKGAQDKQASRITKQATIFEEQKKYNQRLAKAQERQLRVANDEASQNKPSAQPLPVPN